MSKWKKTGLMIVCAVLLMATSVVGTLAYLTAQDEVVNTFTMGNVHISLDETDVDENGKEILDDQGQPVERVQENEYHLLPGQTYIKDPTVTVKAGSEESYIRMILNVYNASAVGAIVDNPKNKLNDFADLLVGWDKEIWKYQDYKLDEENNIISFEFRYKEPVSGYEDADMETEKDQTLPPLFTAIKVPEMLNGEELKTLYGEDNNTADDFRMVVVAHAIQKTGFEDNEDTAWSEFDAQFEAEKKVGVKNESEIKKESLNESEENQ